MDSRNPTADEAARLKKLRAAYARWPLTGLLVVQPLLFLQLLADQLWLKLAMVALGLGLFVWWGLAFTVLGKCPRCLTRMTLPKGSCTACGLRLEAQEAESGTAPCSK